MAKRSDEDEMLPMVFPFVLTALLCLGGFMLNLFFVGK